MKDRIEITIDTNKYYIDWEEMLLNIDYYEWLEKIFPNSLDNLPEEWKFKNWRLREKGR